MKLLLFIKKELTLLTRDLHALALLFVMPTLFILIMSLAMQDTFSEHYNVSIDYVLINNDSEQSSRWLESQLAQGDSFQQVQPNEANKEGNAEYSKDEISALEQMVKSDKVQFLVVIPEDYSDSLQSVLSEPEPIIVKVAPGTRRPLALLFETKLRALTAQLYLNASSGGTSEPQAAFDLSNLNSVEMISTKEGELLPTSVQQNVPAWLVFSMFFIAIPVSTTFLAERSQGTLARLATMGVSSTQLLGAKLFTYMLINMLQVALMFCVGIWLVPLLGGDALSVGNSLFGLFLIALCTSFAAVSLALLIANIAKTNEQATVTAGASNIILAAIGGVMVPSFVMPSAMQTLSHFSPHSWGLQGFLDIILREGGVSSILFEGGLLLCFGSALLLISALLLKRRHSY